MNVPIWVWAATVALIVVALLVDLLVFHRDAHEVTMREAAISSTVWVAFGVLFGIGVWWQAGGERGGEYFAGYLIEKSLAVDNIFVFAVLLSFFAVPPKYQHRVLFWGVLGALLFRAIFIAAGAVLLDRFHWTIYVFGVLLVLTGFKLLKSKDSHVNPASNPAVRGLRRLMPVTDDYVGSKLFVRRNGIRFATPMLAVLLAIETTDVIFAVDSIPAIFAVTDEPFLVFTSNAFAILGLRAMYFLLAGAVERFRYLKVGLAGVLAFVGCKMLLIDVWKVPIVASLLVIAGIIALAVIASLRSNDGTAPAQPPGSADASHPDSEPQPDDDSTPIGSFANGRHRATRKEVNP